MTEMTVFVASPGDVQAERDRLVPVLDELSRWQDLTGQTLRLRAWERHFTPGAGRPVQEGLIDPQIGRPDVTVVIFWKHFGEPTDDAGSPTEHEFNAAVERCEESDTHKLLVYFKTAQPDYGDDMTQIQKVKEFRSRIQDRVLYREFETP